MLLFVTLVTRSFTTVAVWTVTESARSRQAGKHARRVKIQLALVHWKTFKSGPGSEYTSSVTNRDGIKSRLASNFTHAGPDLCQGDERRVIGGKLSNVSPHKLHRLSAINFTAYFTQRARLPTEESCSVKKKVNHEDKLRAVAKCFSDFTQESVILFR